MTKNSQDEIARASAMLSSLRKNIDQIVAIPENYVREYHFILDKSEDSTGITLLEFRVPDSEISPRLMSVDPSGRHYSEEKYVARAFMLTKMDAVLGYFEIITSEKPRKIGFTKPDEQ